MADDKIYVEVDGKEVEISETVGLQMTDGQVLLFYSQTEETIFIIINPIEGKEERYVRTRCPQAEWETLKVIALGETSEVVAEDDEKFKVKTKPNCYKCEYRGEVPGSAHSCCKAPVTETMFDNPMLQMQAIFASVGRMEPVCAPVGGHVVGSEHGIKKGWFQWPWNFDPVWLEKCDYFEPDFDKYYDEVGALNKKDGKKGVDCLCEDDIEDEYF